MKYRLWLLLLSFFWINTGIAQGILEQKISIDITNTPIDEALLMISQKADINIFFSPDIFQQKKNINLSSRQESLKQVLKRCLKNSQVDFRLSDGSLVLFKKTQESYNLSGYLTDAQTGDRLVGANIISLVDGSGCASNAYGFYSKNFEAGKNRLRISYLGYQSKEVNINLSKTQKLDIALNPTITLAEITVKPDKDSSLISADKIETTLPLSWLSQTPTVGGEADIVRYLQLLPGIQSGTDGFGGLHIRGGNSDQNLILFDDVPVYNPSHTFGFYSIFNPDLVKSVKLYKSGFPARYDGRISSVLDIRTKEANNQKFSGTFTMGTTALRGLIEIPIAQGKGGILLSGRKTHIDLWLKPLSRHLKSEDDAEGEMSYQFYDVNIKAHYSVSNSDKFYFSHYQGKDVFSDSEEFGSFSFDPEFNDVIEEETETDYLTDWGNTISSLRWNHLFNNRLFANTTLTYSRFNYLSNVEYQAQAYVLDEPFLAVKANSYYSSLIESYALRSDIDYFINNQHHLKIGANISFQNFRPGIVEFEEINNELDSIEVETENNFEENPVIRTQLFNAYVEDFFTLNDKWSIHSGIHLGTFINGEQIHLIPQPRLVLNYVPSKYLKTSLSIIRTAQFFNLLTRSDAGLPNDLWVPAAEDTDPQKSWQYNIGLSGELGKKYHWKFETYYKTMNNVLRLKNEAFDSEELQESNGLNIEGDDWTEITDFGSGRAYGFETTLEKHKGILSGWISYSWIKSNRTFNQQTSPYLFDIRHSISLTTVYRFNHWLTASANYIFQTGRPFSIQNFDEQDIPFFSLLNEVDLDQNANRLPAYHRMDIGLYASLKGKRFHHKINFSLYNVYNRSNVLFAVGSDEQQSSITGTKGLGIVPSLSYSISW